METVLGQPSHALRTPEVEAFVTRTGGHLGPVGFHLAGRTVRPLHVAPWAEDPDPDQPAILRVLRGDFFCMPFGGNEQTFRGESHPGHGETANEDWTLVEQGNTHLRLELETKVRPGRVEKLIRLVPGHTAVYSRHTVRDMSGPMSYGHHAMLRFPPGEGTGLVSTGPFVFGQAYPGQFEDPARGGRNSFQPGARFDRLERVPLASGELADLSRYPARDGFEDLAMVFADPASPLGWNAVVFPQERYVWFSLRDPRVLTGTILWHSNGGRDYAPWNGRHRNVLGIEDVTSYMHDGLMRSCAENDASREGLPTYVDLSPDKPLEVSTLMAVAEAPPGFDHVERIDPELSGVRLTSRSGLSVSAAVDLSWLGVI